MTKQANLFWEIGDDTNSNVHTREWVGMPEFVSENKKPIQQIIVSFNSYEDVKEFGKLVGITATPKTKSMYYPPRSRDTGEVYMSKFWNDEE